MYGSGHTYDYYFVLKNHYYYYKSQLITQTDALEISYIILFMFQHFMFINFLIFVCHYYEDQSSMSDHSSLRIHNINIFQPRVHDMYPEILRSGKSNKDCDSSQRRASIEKFTECCYDDDSYVESCDNSIVIPGVIKLVTAPTIIWLWR